MASLTTHLRRPEDHGRLAFRPDCPVCRRERLAGTEPIDALVGHRTQALLAASVLALSSASSTAAVAAEPDQEQEGALAPDQVAVDPGLVADPQSDPGGSSIELPVDAAPPAADPGDDTAIEQQIATEEAPAEEAPAPDVSEESVPAPAEPEPTPPPAVSTPEPSPPAPPPPAVTAEPDPDRNPEPVRKQRRPTKVTPSKTVLRIAAPQPQAVAAPPAATIRVAPAAADAHPVRATRRGEPIHVVRANESLWSIARDLLGDEASAARIAREVNRLWALNSSRIGTGDPDLLMTGTRLRVR